MKVYFVHIITEAPFVKIISQLTYKIHSGSHVYTYTYIGTSTVVMLKLLFSHHWLVYCKAVFT
jgi:hypothetical protein